MCVSVCIYRYWSVLICIGMYCLYWYVCMYIYVLYAMVCIDRYLYVFVCIVHMACIVYIDR